MGCCGGGTHNNRRRNAQSQGERAVLPGGEGPVLVRYTGPSVGMRGWQAPSGQRYQFGGSHPLNAMCADDAAYFIELPHFQIVA